MEKVNFRRFPHLCLICGVDSGPIRTFLFLFIGGLVLSSFMIWLWAWATKRVSTKETLARLPLDAEFPEDQHAIK